MPKIFLALKQQLKSGRQAIINNFLLNGKVEVLLSALKDEVDDALISAWTEFGLPPSAALIAVGGYGRGELFPHSDVDVLILLQEQPDAELQGKFEELVQLFWDIGLEIGHSIRTVEECLHEAKADITVQTSLLEARLIVGNAALFQELKQCCDMSMDAQAFFQAKTLELRQRHAKYQNTPYSLEPNCKESPGGLRDLHVILWVAKAAGLGNSWGKLAESHVITSTEASHLKQNECALKEVRIRLHIVTGRQEDRLVFDVQTAIAESISFYNSDTRHASQYLMQRYYRAAKAITQLNASLLQNIEARLFPKMVSPVAMNQHFFNEEVFLLLTLHPQFKDMTARAPAFALQELQQFPLRPSQPRAVPEDPSDAADNDPISIRLTSTL